MTFIHASLYLSLQGVSYRATAETDAASVARDTRDSIASRLANHSSKLWESRSKDSKGSQPGVFTEGRPISSAEKQSGNQSKLSDSIAGDGSEYFMPNPAIILFCYNRSSPPPLFRMHTVFVSSSFYSTVFALRRKACAPSSLLLLRYLHSRKLCEFKLGFPEPQR